jgi:hypothetical protein
MARKADSSDLIEGLGFVDRVAEFAEKERVVSMSIWIGQGKTK